MFMSFHSFLKRPMCGAIEKFIGKFEDISNHCFFLVSEVKWGGVLFCERRGRT